MGNVARHAVRKELARTAEEGRRHLNKALGPSSATMRLVRNKLAYHLDQETMDAAFEAMPVDIALADFHTGQHGTTFFGVADTVATIAIGQLTEVELPIAAIREMSTEVLDAAEALQTFADGYLFAFNLVYFGRDRIAGEVVRLRGLPEVGRAGLGYYLASTIERKRHARSEAARFR